MKSEHFWEKTEDFLKTKFVNYYDHSIKNNRSLKRKS